jgi:hypothetical protein
MHLMDNLVPLSSRIANNETTEHLVHLLDFDNCETLLDLEDFFIFRKCLLLNFLCSFSLVFRELKIRLHFSSNFVTINSWATFMPDAILFCLKMHKMAMTWTR